MARWWSYVGWPVRCFPLGNWLPSKGRSALFFSDVRQRLWWFIMTKHTSSSGFRWSWHDPKFRAIVYQVLILALVALGVWYLVSTP